jgi:hypothetical protein
MFCDRERWDWLEERWWGTQRAAALAQLTLEQLMERQRGAKASLQLASSSMRRPAWCEEPPFLAGT